MICYIFFISIHTLSHTWPYLIFMYFISTYLTFVMPMIFHHALAFIHDIYIYIIVYMSWINLVGFQMNLVAMDQNSKLLKFKSQWSWLLHMSWILMYVFLFEFIQLHLFHNPLISKDNLKILIFKKLHSIKIILIRTLEINLALLNIIWELDPFNLLVSHEWF